MPRTKQTRKPKQARNSLDESDLLVKDFERKVQFEIDKKESEAKTAIKSFQTFVDIVMSRLPPEILQMSIAEVLFYDENKENHNEVTSSMIEPTTVKAKTKKTKRTTAISDDGYVTENASTVTRASRATKVTSSEARPMRRTRSSSRDNKPKLSEISQKTVRGKRTTKANESIANMDNFKTPMLKPSNNEYSIVTPKVKPNTPMSVLRRPRQGEMVLSMQGSPLLISSVVQERTANINVPLGNGNVISLLPNHGLRVSHIPDLDHETMRQLETLKCHLEKVIGPK